MTTAVVATLYVYWTKTPQYALLQTLSGDKHIAPAQSYSQPDQPTQKRLAVPVQREPLTTRMADLQSRLLLYQYGVKILTIQERAKRAMVQAQVNQTRYDMTFDEQPDGHWTLRQFAQREDFVREATARRSDNPFLLLAGFCGAACHKGSLK
ncbi:MAG: hypothetical protein H0W13_12145 [Nitrospirales bacterium]|nr:hypothetical protein [Nitrospirales bacterium]